MDTSLPTLPMASAPQTRRIDLSDGRCTLMFELRVVGDAISMSKLHSNVLEHCAKHMRSASAWTVVSFRLPSRNELVGYVVIQRATPVTRVDNAAASWVHSIQSHLADTTLARKEWRADKYLQYYVDAHARPDGYQAAVALLQAMAKQAGAEKVLVSSNLLPSLGPAPKTAATTREHKPQAAQTQQPAASSAPIQRK